MLTVSTRSEQSYVFRARGTITADNAEAFRNQVAEAYKRSGLRFLVVDMGDVDFVDSMGIGVLVSLSRLAAELGGDLQLASLQPAPKMVVEITRINQIIPCHPSVLAAIGEAS